MTNAAKQLCNLINEGKANETKPYDTQAEVIRVEGDIAWCHFPSGVDETPVQMTIACRVGDTVQVRVANGSAWLVGNLTAPPTDDKTAKDAAAVANKAFVQSERAKSTAEQALELARIGGNENQYFWHTETGVDTGAHITEIPREDFLQNPRGGNLLARSNGIAIRDAMTELASIGRDQNDNVEIVLGVNGEAQATIGADGIIMSDEDGNETVKIQSGGTIRVPMSEKFTILSSEPTSTSLTYTTSPLVHDIDWGTLTIRLSCTIGAVGFMDGSCTLSLASASSTASGTLTLINGNTVGNVTASLINGNSVRLNFTSLDETLVSIKAVVVYSYTTTYNFMSIRGNLPQISFINDQGGATSYIRAYTGGPQGNNVVYQSGGNVYFGGGNYPNNRYAFDLGEDTGKNAYIGADDAVFIETNASAIGNRKEWRFGSDGKIKWPNAVDGVMQVGNNATLVGFGDNTTSSVEFWGNNSNKVSIRIGNTDNNQRFALQGKSDRVALYNYDTSSFVWQIIEPQYRDAAKAAVSVGTSAVKNLTSISLTAGTWFVSCACDFASNATGRRALQLSLTSTGEALSNVARDVSLPVSGAVTVLNFVTVLTPTATTTYYLNAWQNSGSSLSTNGRIEAIKLK